MTTPRHQLCVPVPFWAGADRNDVLLLRRYSGRRRRWLDHLHHVVDLHCRTQRSESSSPAWAQLRNQQSRAGRVGHRFRLVPRLRRRQCSRATLERCNHLVPSHPKQNWCEHPSLQPRPSPFSCLTSEALDLTDLGGNPAARDLFHCARCAADVHEETIHAILVCEELRDGGLRWWSSQPRSWLRRFEWLPRRFRWGSAVLWWTMGFEIGRCRLLRWRAQS